ncbi:bfr1+ protein [Protomyces lactucae-debilis]|uniref:Bfr1+ protein n=1 Tax=Protomyces lactucae-debilis TaxID=2754530 RepID=A0A1Y2FFD1_PROLT|nr:bfr1+ protein [Protomyces lactucae-debilis]ORY82114.1 bfr1+ protein [Protomyces lactucae-debilis]
MTGPHSPSRDNSNESSDTGTITDNHALARTQTFTDAQFDELRQTLSKRTTAGDPLDLEHNFSLERYVRSMMQQSEKEGRKGRSAGVAFKDVSTYGKGADISYQQTIFDPILSLVRFKETLASFRHTPTKKIISNFNGLVREGEMLLVLGKPGAGCSTLLKTLAGEHGGYTKIEGDIHFNGVDLERMQREYKAEVVYNGEMDIHFPHLTVAQTLEFAAETRAPRNRLHGWSRKEYIKNMRDVLATTFGLKHTYNTRVGNDYVRGVSGGERKRVSIAETLSSRAIVQMWDNSTRGLDASTALEYAKALRVMTNLVKSTCIVCIYQAGEHLYEVFDKVTVVYAGRQIYFGPAESAKQYFVDMGFECPQRQTTADFLTAVTDPKARFARNGYAKKVPRTPEEFEERWTKSEEYKDLLREMDTYDKTFKNSDAVAPIQNSVADEKAKHVRKKSPYTITYPMQLKLCAKRSYQRMLGDPAYIGANIFSSIFQALIVGSVFYNTPQDTSGYFSRGGVIFFAILVNALSAMAEISSLYEQRPIIARHKSFAMYHPSADALSQLLADIPIKLVVVTAFDLILYFMTNLSRTPGQFFIFYLFTFLVTMCMTSFFRMLAAITKTVDQATTLGGLGVLALVIYTGYLIPLEQTGWWFRWIKYINPISYGFEALMVNEFKLYDNTPCAQLVPSGPGYSAAANQACAVTGAQPNSITVNGLNYLSVTYGYELSNLWRNLGIVIAFWIGFLAINVIATEFIAPVAEGGDVVLFKRGGAPKHLAAAAAGKDVSGDLEKQNEPVLEHNPADDIQESSEEVSDVIAKSEDIFTWQNLDYVIQIKGESRKLLNNVQGYVKPKSLTCLMGESGAGKTTLLNVLAQRVDTGVVTGDMLVSGQPLGHSFQRNTGYVQQQDIHMAEMTVRESLRFSAVLRQPKTVTRKEKYEYVEEVIKLLEMEQYAEAVVGTAGKGLNVEQRKRLTIGVELAAKPKLLLFLDEPTSGLDSQSAWSIVLLLRKLANAGQAILCTIHQPSAILFEQFDRLLLLQKGGRTAYFGDIGKSSKTLCDYFERQGGGKCGKNDNPAEYILDAIGAGATASSDKNWFEMWTESEECKKVTKDIQEMTTKMRSEHKNDEIEKGAGNTYAMGYATQFWEVTKRLFISDMRAPVYVGAKMALNVVAGLFVSFTFYKADNSAQGLQNKLFAVFMAVVLSTSLMNQIQPRFVSARNLFEVREMPSKIYSWPAFMFAQIVCEIPLNAVCGTLFFLPWYFAVNFPSGFVGSALKASRGAYAWGILMMFELWLSTFAQLAASFVPNEQTAAIVSTLLFTFVIIFNGVLQPPAALPSFWQFAYRVSPFTYLIEGLFTDVVSGVPVECKAYELTQFTAPAGQTCQDYMQPFFANGGLGQLVSSATDGVCQYCRYTVSDDFFLGVNMKFSHRQRDIALVFAYAVFNACAAFLLFWLFRINKFRFLKKSDKKKVAKAKQAKTEAGDREAAKSDTGRAAEKVGDIGRDVMGEAHPQGEMRPVAN